MADQNIKVRIDLDIAEFNKNVKQLSDALSKVLGREIQLVNANLEQTAQAADKAGNAMSRAGKIAGSTSAEVKKSNQAWTNLSLVIQDLPYGFRGIQNNLPALFGSIAAAAGPLYFAFSALVAGITFFDQQSQKSSQSAKSLYESLNSLKTETLALGSIFSAVREGTLGAADATKIYNEKLGDLFGTAKSVYEAEQLYIKKTEGYIKAQYYRAKADIEYEKAKEALAKKDAAYAEDQVGILGKLAIATSAFFKSGAISGVSGFYKQGVIFAKDYADKQTELAGYVSDYEEAQFQKRLALGQRYMSQAYKIEQEYGIKSTTIKDKTDKKAIAALGKSIETQQNVNEQIIQNLIEAKKQEVKLVEDDAFAKYEKSKELAQLEKSLALEKIKNGEYTTKQQLALQEGAYIEYANKLVLLDESMQEQLLKQDAKTRKEKKKRDEEDYANQQKFGKNQIDLIDTRLKVELRLNKDNVIGQQEAIKQSMAKVGALMASSFGTGMFPVYLDFYDQLNAKLEAMDQNALRGAEAMKRVNSIMSDMASGTFVAFADALGKSLAGEDVNVFETFGTILASGLQDIGKALIAYGLAMDAFKKAFSNPIAAVAAGVALVAAGAILKSNIAKTSGEDTGVQKFANGGIISGPTMGLMGEYPGAKSNPEVVAPLDKLKDMIGGDGNGTFVLRGQDLLLSVNRAQKASNIKGQNISLA